MPVLDVNVHVLVTGSIHRKHLRRYALYRRETSVYHLQGSQVHVEDVAKL